MQAPSRGDASPDKGWSAHVSDGLMDFLGAVKEELRVLRTAGVGRVAENLVFKTLTVSDDLAERVGPASNETLARTDQWGQNAAHIAAGAGKIQELESLICLDPHILSAPDSQGMLPAHCAASSGHADTLQMIHGVDPLLPFVATKDGVTPAHRAASEGQAHVLEWLHGIDASSLRARKWNGCTPCHRAAVHGHANVIRLLHGLDPDLLKARSADGLTPVHAAAAAGKLRVLRAVAKLDKDLLTVLSASGQTPLDVVYDDDTIAFLKRACGSEAGAISGSSSFSGSITEALCLSSPEMEPMLSKAESASSAGRVQKGEDCMPRLLIVSSPPLSPAAVLPERKSVPQGAKEEDEASCDFERRSSSEGWSSPDAETPTADAQDMQAVRSDDETFRGAAPGHGEMDKTSKHLMEMFLEEACARKSAQIELGRMHLENTKLRSILAGQGLDGAGLAAESEAAELESGTTLIQAENAIRDEVSRRVEEALLAVRMVAEKQAEERLQEQVREILQKEQQADPQMGEALSAVLDARLKQVLASVSPGKGAAEESERHA